MRALRIDLATAEVGEALRARGIRSILLKGPALERWLYGSEQRVYVDCDLLVGPDDLERTEAILTERGFVRDGLESMTTDWPKHALVLRRPRDKVSMDLHRTFVGVGVTDEVLWDVLTERTEELEIAGSRVEVLPLPGRALTLALHAAKDGARVGKVREDLRRGLAQPEEVWRGATELAGRLDALPTFAWGLRRIPEGEELAARLSLPTEVPVNVALRADGGAPPLATGIDWMLRSPGWRGKMAVAARKVFPSPTYMRAWSPLARRGRLGLAAAYAIRPFWTLAHAVPAIVAVGRARRRASRSSE